MAGWAEPDPLQIVGYEAVEATCDGLDNDCDGPIDEELIAPAADNSNGLCAGRSKECSGGLGWLDPDPTQIIGYEAVEATCDGWTTTATASSTRS